MDNLSVVVLARWITEEEARLVGYQKLGDLRKWLRHVGFHWVQHDILKKIRNYIESAREEVEDTRIEDLDAESLDKQIMALLELIDGFNPDVRFRYMLNNEETKIVLAHSCLAWIADAQGIMDDPMKARSNISLLDLRKHLATVFQNRFPKFFGYRLVVQGQMFRLRLKLVDGPSQLDVPDAAPMYALMPYLDEFLRWELRKTGLAMKYYIYPPNPQPKDMLCDINVI